MIEIKDFIPRKYQEAILQTCIDKNTLVVLPTGMGKTAICILLAVNQLNEHPGSKILVCSPTRPLSSQHIKTFKDNTTIPEEDIILLTGMINPKKRKEIWENAIVIVATPQTIESDLINNRINLENFSMLCVDEAHRSKMKYANTFVAKKYIEQSKFPRILGLTASPGSTKDKINEICENLFIDGIEIRTEEDEDVKPYLQEKQIELVNVELPQSFKIIHNLIKNVYREKINNLKNFGISKPVSLINKTDLLKLQVRFRQDLERGSQSAYASISLAAQAIKLNYALELLETQGINSLYQFLGKLNTEETKAAKIILNNKEISKAVYLTKELIEKNIEHPKMDKLCEIIREELGKNSNSKIIIFANYRNTVKYLVSLLRKIPNAKPIELMGQKDGITQKQQLNTIKEFEKGSYNILVGTSITEEGIHISSANLAIFYDNVSSAIRRIQRGGRIARIQPGRIIYLITKGTRDSGFYWKSARDVDTMKKIIYKMRDENLLEKSLDKF